MPGRPANANPPPPQRTTAPSIGVYFTCSNQYLRVFRNNAGTHYLARCPKCAKTINFRVAPGGTNQRFFEVSC